ncbi:MAG: DNA internalization-related competence protein ComEC/Rec2 [Gammaproteobacteria bacterium]|nr:MAG: DNA internalization-related competence protein ComEC/Rec2 [Gammaproteobacteria bacterium]
MQAGNRAPAAQRRLYRVALKLKAGLRPRRGRGAWAGWPVACLAFAAGVLALQMQATLPPRALTGTALAVAAWAAWRRPEDRPIAAFLLGFAWAAWQAQGRLDGGVTAAALGRDLRVEGAVVSLPERHGGVHRFDFRVDHLLDGPTAALRTPAVVRLSVYRPKRGAALPQAGERWRLRVRLKPVHGQRNPGTFDYETWAFARGVRGSGYVRAGPGTERLGPEPGAAAAWLRFRARLLALQSARLGEAARDGRIQALTLGWRGAVDEAQWALLRATGTTHLMAISGMHVGLLAALAYALGLALWRRLRARLAPWRWPPAQRLAALTALAAAAAYALLSGFSVPTQRALLMLAVGLAAWWSAAGARPWRAWCLALAVVLLWDPFAPLTPGFWLSFAAVAVLIHVFAGRRRPAATGLLRWRRAAGDLCRAQFALILGLAPLSAYFFGEAALLGALANLVAVPLVGLGVLPLAVAGTALLPFDDLSSGLLQAAAAGLAGLDRLLEPLSQAVAPWRPAQPPAWSLPLAALGVALLSLPRGVPGRWLGLGCLLPALTHAAPAPPPGALWLTVLDVGQGNAVLLRTAGHAALYDAGPRSAGGFDAGARIVLPHLRSLGIGRLDALLVSHEDQDHAGGAGAVLEGLDVAWVLAADPAPYRGRAGRVERCRRGRQWRWDGVTFRLLHPEPETPGDGNDASCVLEIEAGGRRVLLAGDIGARVERRLAAAGRLRPAALVLAPHHGSAGSSSPAWVDAVAPEQVVYSAAWANRWGFPRPAVTARYAAAGARQWHTGRDGALEFEVSAAGLRLRQAARARSRYWHHRPP